MWIETTEKQWVRSDTIELVWINDSHELNVKCTNGFIHCITKNPTENGQKLFIQIICHSSSVMVYQDDIIQGGIGHVS